MLPNNKKTTNCLVKPYCCLSYYFAMHMKEMTSCLMKQNNGYHHLFAKLLNLILSMLYLQNCCMAYLQSAENLSILGN